MTEVWFRNPHNYVRELAEVGGPFRVVWDRGILVKKHIDPVKHAKMYFGESADFRILCIGQQGSAELNATHDMTNPIAVYPTWEYGEDMDILEEMMSNNIAEDPMAITADVAPDERPVPNQEHRVVVTNLPNLQLAANRGFYRQLKTMQEDYPECILHIHSSYSFRIMFGQGFGSADVEPRGDAANGRVILPSGKTMAYARTVGALQWVNLLGFSVVDLKDPRNRCMFNIKSANWAGAHFNENIKFASRGEDRSDPLSPVTSVPTTTSTNSVATLNPQAGDKVICDQCSLSPGCKYYRVGAVCSLPGSDSTPLIAAFKSRDSFQIIEALGTLQGAAVKRLERGMSDEEEYGELDPEVTRLIAMLFKQGVTLAKLVDPTLTKPLVQIGSNGFNPNGTSRQMTSAVVQVLEKQGIRREDITTDMVVDTLKEMGMSEEENPQKQIVQGGVENVNI